MTDACRDGRLHRGSCDACDMWQSLARSPPGTRLILGRSCRSTDLSLGYTAMGLSTSQSCLCQFDSTGRLLGQLLLSFVHGVRQREPPHVPMVP